MFSVARHRSPGSHRAAAPPARSSGRRWAACGVVLLATATGCGTLTGGNGGEPSTDINVTSTMMQEGRPLPRAYTCEGEGISPGLQWSGLPDEQDIASIAVVADDPDAAHVFWVLYGLDPQIAEIRQNSVPQSASVGRNSTGRAEYTPPCPEEGDPHEYRFTVYALRGEPNLPEEAALEESLEAISHHTVARGTLTTTSE